jgi:glycosyltransferase involved in cell wall biosynthesis
MNSPPLASLIIPVFNEQTTIERVILRVMALPLDKEIIVVSDGSTDGTLAVLDRYSDRVKIIRLRENVGRGGALVEGLKISRGRVVAFLDADLEVDPSAILPLIEEVSRGKSDAVLGSRFLDGSCAEMTFLQRNGNIVVTWLANFIFRTKVSDVQTGTAAFRGDSIRAVPLCSRGWDLSIETLARLSRGGARIMELPIRYAPRRKDEGKKLRWSDFFGALYFIVKYGLIA